MIAPLDAAIIIPISILLIVLMLFTFDRVLQDYRILGKLSRPVEILQTGYFVVYAISSYAFLDSRLSRIDVHAWSFPFALVLLIPGFLIVLLSMPFLGRKSFGGEVGHLHTEGLYHYSRNPQLVGFILFVAGYAMSWPSWQGIVWVGLCLLTAWRMVSAEEEHLQRVFVDEYREYCRQVHRWVGRK